MKDRGLWRFALAAFAVVLWAVMAWKHKAAGKVFGQFFQHAKTWGPDGIAQAEQLIFRAIFGLGAALVVVMAAWFLSSAARRRAFPELAVRWGAWALFPLAANRYLVCIQSENVHFPQYGLVALLLGIATGHPRLAFLATTFLGFVDELAQWWTLYWFDYLGRLEWTDMVLNAAGAAGGALVITSIQRVRRYAEGREDLEERTPPLKLALGLAALAGCLALFLAFAETGHYPRWPFWEQIDNRKPFHNFDTREGVPILLVATFLLHALVEERRRTMSLGTVAVVLIGVHIAVTPPPTKTGVPVVEDVPTVKVPRAGGAIAIDGVVDPAEWKGAAEVELGFYAPRMTYEQYVPMASVGAVGSAVPTKVRALWDDANLYVSFVCSSSGVWTRDFPKDHPEIPLSPCVEVFLDMDGAERSYYEFEVTPGNQKQDLFVYWPQAPMWVPQPYEVLFVGLNRWDAQKFRHAVTVQGGPLEVLPITEMGYGPRGLPPTTGYTVEMAIAWEDLVGRYVPPKEGDRIRANFFRIERPRPLGAQPDSYMAWSPTHAPLSFHRPRYFGVIEFVK